MQAGKNSIYHNKEQNEWIELMGTHFLICHFSNFER